MPMPPFMQRPSLSLPGAGGPPMARPMPPQAGGVPGGMVPPGLGAPPPMGAGGPPMAPPVVPAMRPPMAPPMGAGAPPMGVAPPAAPGALGATAGFTPGSAGLPQGQPGLPAGAMGGDPGAGQFNPAAIGNPNSAPPVSMSQPNPQAINALTGALAGRAMGAPVMRATPPQMPTGQY